jgi:predicted RNA binding protein YcfA (HicA-like mRNA interferase family)
MPPFGPVKRRELIRCLRQAGFEGPFPRGKHEFMQRGAIRLTVPNPHQGDIGKELLIRLLRQAGIDRKEWEAL